MTKNNFIFVLVIVMVLLSSCSFVVQDTRTPDEKATAEATRSLVILPTVTPNPPDLPTVEPDVLPEEEEGLVEPEPPSTPPCQDIKGNISSSGEMIYHLPDGAYYDQVKIDESKGEKFFCSEEEAAAEGFRKSSR